MLIHFAHNMAAFWMPTETMLCLVCCGGGDRTRRHNLLRNIVYFTCASAGLYPELEKPGLLPARPLQGGRLEDGSRNHESDDPSARRPADVFIPRWRAGPAACLDFAVTSGLRPEVIAESATNADAACTRYEDFKKTYKNTAH